MVQTLYADGIRNMALINGMIRMEYATCPMVDAEAQENVDMETQCVVVVTPNNFLQCFRRMEQMAEKMIQAGIVSTKAEERRSGPACNTEMQATA